MYALSLIFLLTVIFSVLHESHPLFLEGPNGTTERGRDRERDIEGDGERGGERRRKRKSE